MTYGGVKPFSALDGYYLLREDYYARRGYPGDARRAPTLRARSTIYADDAAHEEHVAFMDWLRECRIAYWAMSGEDLERVKNEWRKTR